jgi:hypothetical protein
VEVLGFPRRRAAGRMDRGRMGDSRSYETHVDSGST